MTIAFELDCLFTQNGTPRDSTLALLSALINKENTIYVWTGNSLEYVIEKVRKLNLEDKVICAIKAIHWVDISFDIKQTNLGIYNFIL